ncbi:AI-2E family transporter, partial [Pseudomonas sp. MWU12-2312b]
MVPTPLTVKTLSGGLLDVLIRAGLIVVMVLFCFEIFRPFRDLMLWSLILAITLYPLQTRLRGALGQKDGLIATLIVLAAIVILMVPVYLLGSSV